VVLGLVGPMDGFGRAGDGVGDVSSVSHVLTNDSQTMVRLPDSSSVV
jgi:hypothetical protein